MSETTFSRCPNHKAQRACTRDNGHDGECFFDVVVPRKPEPSRDSRAEVIEAIEKMEEALNANQALADELIREAIALLRKDVR